MTENESAERAAVVAAARAWIGTPYHNCADIKHVGVDCGMLLVRVYVDTGLCASFDPRPYPVDWHLHRSEERYLGLVIAHGFETTAPRAGDIVLLRYGRCYSHGGIVTGTDPLAIVHAYHPAGCVLEEEIARNAILSDAARRPRFFSLWRGEADAPSGTLTAASRDAS
jgi:hypothetical protein